jgi:hypothetical protein
MADLDRTMCSAVRRLKAHTVLVSPLETEHLHVCLNEALSNDPSRRAGSDNKNVCHLGRPGHRTHPGEFTRAPAEERIPDYGEATSRSGSLMIKLQIGKGSLIGSSTPPIVAALLDQRL